MHALLDEESSKWARKIHGILLNLMDICCLYCLLANWLNTLMRERTWYLFKRAAHFALLRRVLFIIKAGVAKTKTGMAKTKKIQNCVLYQNEILHVTLARLLTIRKP